MQNDDYQDLSREAWNHAHEHHKPKSHVPAPLTAAQAKDLFAKATRFALVTVTRRYANYARQQQGLPAVASPTLPRTATDWIESQIKGLDGLLGNNCASHFQTIANGFLAHLRAAEVHFLQLKEDKR